MASVSRSIAGDTLTHVGGQHTRPFCLVRMTFGGEVIHLSEAGQVVWNGDTYVEGAVRVGTFSWTPDGDQEGTVELTNENNSASSLILNYGSVEVPVDIWLAHLDASGTLVTPELVVTGVLDGADIAPASTVCSVVTGRAKTEYLPYKTFTKAAGFNFLPKRGTIITWNNEKYVLEGA